MSSKDDAVVPISLADRLPLAAKLGHARATLVLCGVLCQLATVAITWPLWQTRTEVPHLPLVDLPQVPFGWLMVVSSLAVLVRPTGGVTAHWVVLILASLFDQYRLQPQVFLIALLITACVSDRVRLFSRWLIASTWVWAGLHKLLSPDWMGHASHWLVDRSGLDADQWYIPFAVAVGVSELIVGIVACVRPRWAAYCAVPMHLGIIVFLFAIQWNMSVVPWNFAMATIGAWIMWTAPKTVPRDSANLVLAVVCLVYPLGFYFGWVDHGFAGVLYSDWLPRGQITAKDGREFIRGWGDLNVPFPSERRLLRLYFEQVAEPGDKLHIADPRRRLNDQFFVLSADGTAKEIDVDTFLIPQPLIPGAQESPTTSGPTTSGPTVAGIGIDEKRAVFALSRAGARMVRPRKGEPIFAVEFRSDNYEHGLLEAVQGLPNVMQVQLAETRVSDDDLRHLSKLRLLTGLGLRDTSVSDAGIQYLEELPYLQHIEHAGTSITDEMLRRVKKNPF